MKYSSFAGIVAWSQGEILLRHGQSIEEDHPLYKERPDLFQGLAPGADLTAQPQHGEPLVERATRAPGEVRSTRVPKSGSAQ